MDKKLQDKWYFSTALLVIAFLCIGPLALPLLWLNPRFTKKTKIITSLIIGVLSYYLIVLFINALKILNEYYRLIFSQF